MGKVVPRPTVCLAGFTFSRFESGDVGVWPRSLGRKALGEPGGQCLGAQDTLSGPAGGDSGASEGLLWSFPQATRVAEMVCV